MYIYYYLTFIYLFAIQFNVIPSFKLRSDSSTSLMFIYILLIVPTIVNLSCKPINVNPTLYSLLLLIILYNLDHNKENFKDNLYATTKSKFYRNVHERETIIEPDTSKKLRNHEATTTTTTTRPQHNILPLSISPPPTASIQNPTNTVTIPTINSSSSPVCIHNKTKLCDNASNCCKKKMNLTLQNIQNNIFDSKNVDIYPNETEDLNVNIQGVFQDISGYSPIQWL